MVWFILIKKEVLNMSDTDLSNTISDEILLATIRDCSSDTVYFKDANSRYVWNSKAHAEQFGLSDPKSMKGRSDFDFFPSDFAERARKEELEIMNTKTPQISNIEKLEKEDGTVIWYSASKYPLLDKEGNCIGTWGSSRDITKLKSIEEELARANAKLKRLSRVDELTALFNRRYFYEIMEKLASQYDRRERVGDKDDPKNTFSLISLDIDHFKVINDTFGHPKGDDVLRLVSGTLVAHSRKSDMVFRVGGDEFMMILPDTPLKGAWIQAERIRTALNSAPIMLDNNPIRITASLGIASYIDHDDVTELIHVADERLYTSKNLGRDRTT